MVASAGLSDLQTASLLSEVAACVRAHRPLDDGLRHFADEDAGRVGCVARILQQRLQAGVPLSEAVADQLPRCGPHVSAALRISDRPAIVADALQGLADLMLARRELRLRAMVAAIYPGLVLLVSYIVLVAIFASLVATNYPWFRWPDQVVWGAAWLTEYWWLPPLVLLAVVGIVFSPVAGRLRSGLFAPNRGATALFCDSLAWQIEAGIPLTDALRGAAGIGGTPAERRAADDWANAIERGETTARSGRGFPPLVGWIVNTGGDGAYVAISLRRLAATYRDAMRRRERFWVRGLPAFAGCFIGGAMAALYIAAVIWPLYSNLAASQ
jgi:general secretion pathway protein F